MDCTPRIQALRSALRRKFPHTAFTITTRPPLPPYDSAIVESIPMR